MGNKAHPLQYSAGGSSSGLPEQVLDLAKILRVLLHDADAAEPRGCTAGLATRRYAAAHEHACSRAGIDAFRERRRRLRRRELQVCHEANLVRCSVEFT